MKTTCQCLSFHTNRDGDAWLSSLTALVTVDPVAEGADAGGERCEGEIVVVPLPKQGHHVSEFSVVDHARVCCVQDVVGHLSHLRVEENGFNFKSALDSSKRVSGVSRSYQWEQEVVHCFI